MAGVSEAEGCFTVSALLRGEDKYQIQIRFTVTQKGEIEMLEKMAVIFGGKVSKVRGDIYNMAVQLTKLDKVLEYFARYPLRTRKQEVYKVWVNLREMVMRKEHLSEKQAQVLVEVEKVQNLNKRKGEGDGKEEEGTSKSKKKKGGGKDTEGNRKGKGK